MAGHAGKAFWFSKASGEFVTSSYYYDVYPEWVAEFNTEKHAFAYGGKSWDLLHDRSTYLFGDKDDRPWETDLAGYGRTFPHPFGSADGKYFTTLLTISPAGDQLTLDFAKTLMLNEAVGNDAVPDYLSVSLSSTDYVGHLFGPSSLEAEDHVLRLDRALADFFGFVDEHVGLENTLIVLSADHGSPEVPGYLGELGISAGYVKPDEWDRTKAIAALKRELGVAEELIERYSHPYVYLNKSVIAEHNLDPSVVEVAVAKALIQFEGVSMAVSSTALSQGGLPDSAIYDAVRRNFNPERSGDVYVVFEPNWFINDFDGLVVASTHGSPWRYDSFVPIVFAGSSVPAQHVARRVYTVDVAPTRASYLRTAPPSGAIGVPLREVLASRQ